MQSPISVQTRSRIPSKKRIFANGFHKLINLFKSADFFGEGIAFTVDGSDAYKSLSGSIVSLMITVVTCIYGWQLVQVMQLR